MRTRRLTRGVPLLAAAALATALLGACTGATSSTPTWRPQPSFTGDGGANVPGDLPGQPSQTAGPSGPSRSGSPGSSADPNVVATKLTTPTAVAVLPDFTALVGERTTGRIHLVQPVAGRPTPVVKTLAGISAVGGGGLMDLMLSPYYRSDGLIFAYLTTATDNRVVDFTLHGPVTPVLTGIPRGTSGNFGRLATDGRDVYVATGDAGEPALAADPGSLAGKVLRIDEVGRPATGNPVPGSPIYASGARTSPGLCYSPGVSALFHVATPGTVSVVAPSAALGSAASAVGTLPTGNRNPGGCAVQGSSLYVTSTDGQSLLAAGVATANGVRLGGFRTVLSKTYGRLLTVAAGGDGSLWLTTTNRDGHGTPVPDDERVIRIMPPSGGSQNKPV